VAEQDAVQKPAVGPFEDRAACVRHFDDDEQVADPEALCGWMAENTDLAQEYDPQDGGILEFVEALKEPSAEQVLTDLQVTFVSGVEDPAIDSQWVYAKDAEQAGADWGVTAPLVLQSAIEKQDDEADEAQKAWAPVLIPNETDKQGDVVPADEIETAAHDFLADYRQIDTDHDLFDGEGVPIESWTLKEAQTFTTPDGEETREYPAGTWMMGVQFADGAWQRVKDGELTGFSIYGEAAQIGVTDFLNGDVSPADDNGAGAATAAALAAKGATGSAAETQMTDDTNDGGADPPTADAEVKELPPEAAEMLTNSINAYLAASEESFEDAGLQAFLKWGVETGELGVQSMSVAGKDIGVEAADDEDADAEEDEEADEDDDGGPPMADQTMSDTEQKHEGEESPADGEAQTEGGEEPTLTAIHETVKETNETVKSVQDRVDDLEAEVFGPDDSGDDGEDGEPEPDVDAAVEAKMADILGVEKSALPEDDAARNEVIRKHIHEHTDDGRDAADPDKWSDDDFAALTGDD
jgi:hypothetical protein